MINVMLVAVLDDSSLGKLTIVGGIDFDEQFGAFGDGVVEYWLFL